LRLAGRCTQVVKLNRQIIELNMKRHFPQTL